MMCIISTTFLIFKMTHPKDVKYIEEMIPNISEDVIEKMKSLQPGTCVAFGSAFKIPMIVRLEMPNPAPYSSSCDVSTYWNSKTDISSEISSDILGNNFSVGNTEVNSSTLETSTEVLASDELMVAKEEHKNKFLVTDN